MRRAGGRAASRLAARRLFPAAPPAEARAAAGLFLASAVMLAAGLISVLGMGGARGRLERMAEESLPRLEKAVAVERRMHAVTAHISAYSLTGDMARYSLARECLAGIRALAGGDSAPASAGPELRSGHLPLWEGMRKLDRLIEEYRSLAEDAAARRSRLRAGMRDLPAPAAALAEQALAAGLARDRAALENAEKAFAGQAPQAKESRESIEALRRNLEAGLALDQDRAAVFDALSATVRDAALRAAADMAASARNADGALHGAMMTLAAAVVLGCALAAGAAVLLLRAAREKRKAP